ncbi:hypothetical protein Tco_1295924 [Tanacetum coccineum]
MALESVKVSHLVKDVRQKGTHKGNQRGNNYGKGKVINMVRKNVNDKKRKSRIQEKEGWMNVPITFPPVLPGDMSDEPLIVEAEVEGSLSFHQSPVEGVSNILSGVLGRGVAVTKEDIVGDIIQKRRIIPKNHHEIHRCSITVPVQHHTRKNCDYGFKGYPLHDPLYDEISNANRDCHACHPININLRMQKIREEVLVNPAFPDQKITSGRRFSKECRFQLLELLKNSKDVFAWKPSDMTGVPRQKVNGAWRMCIDFKNNNSACPEDYYPLPEIDLRIESAMGFCYKCFLDAYKGTKPLSLMSRIVIKEINREGNVSEYSRNIRKPSTNQHEVKSEEMLFGVEEGKFLGYMVLLQGSKPFREDQGMLWRHEFQDEYRWTKEAEKTFQEIKRLIMELPSLTTPRQKETSVSGVLMAERSERQTPIWALQRSFRRIAHKVIENQPIKKILNKPEAFGKLAKYVIKLGAYDITYISRNVVKGQVLVDFLNETPTGSGQNIKEINNLSGERPHKKIGCYNSR